MSALHADTNGRTETGARLFALVACLVATCALALHAPRRASATREQSAPNTSRTPSPPPPPGAPLTPQERRGKAIYVRGESPSGREVVALVGEIDVPASTMTCAGCHGMKGEGKTEGNVTAGNLQWSNLTKPDGHTHPTGRKHGAFDERSFARATVEGIDPAGNTLQSAMPRYKLSAEGMADLIAYLKRIETDREPGVSDTSISVGLLAPAKGALGETGQAIRAVTAAYFEEINSQGGIYNRKLELKVAETGDTPSATAANLERLVTNDQVFALVNVLSAGADAEIAALAQRQEVPLVGAITLTPQTAAPLNRQVFYLLPGVAEQSRALVSFAAQKLNDKNARTALVIGDDALSRIEASAVEEQSKAVGWAVPVRSALPQGGAAATVAELKAKGVQAVFLFASGATSFLGEAEKAGYFPQVYLLGATAGGDILNAPAGFKDKIFLAFPTAPTDITPEGASNFRALAAKYQLPTGHAAAQISAYAAAQLFVEALKRAGRDLSRDKLITALEGLYEYDTRLTPPLTFGPNRRVGASGAHIVAVDVEKKQFVPTGVWMKLDR